MEIYSFMFSSRSFTVLAFTFRPMIHLKLMFVYDVGVKVHIFPIPRYSNNSSFDKTSLSASHCFSTSVEKSDDGLSAVLFLGSFSCTSFS